MVWKQANKTERWRIYGKEMKMQNVLNYTKSNKRLCLTKDFDAQLYALCGLTVAAVKYIEKTIIDMDASR